MGNSVESGSPHSTMHYEITKEVFVQLQEALAFLRV